MATHSSTLAWKIPWMEEPGRLQSMGSQRVRHDRAISLSHGQNMVMHGARLVLSLGCSGKTRHRMDGNTKEKYLIQISGPATQGLRISFKKKKKILFILRFGCSVSSLRWAGVAREASPTLEGRYLTTGPPEKSLRSFFKLRIENFMPPKDSP